jgi:hypothetical protein
MLTSDILCDRAEIKEEKKMEHEIEKCWKTKAGFQAVCLMVNLGHGYHHRCGYVGIPKDHPLYGVNYGQYTEVLKEAYEKVLQGPIGKRGIMPIFCHERGVCTPDIVFDVHGGLTYSSKLDDYPSDWNKNHPEEKLWWYGFDCAHCDDKEDGGRSLEYVEAECESLAEQLAAIKRQPSRINEPEDI